MKQSGYLQKNKVEKQTLMDISGEANRQLMADCFAMMLHDPVAMEGRPLGPEKIQRLMTEYLPPIIDEFYDALLVGDEADVAQEHMDQALRPIYLEKFEPFKKRYPFIRELRYSLPKRR